MPQGRGYAYCFQTAPRPVSGTKEIGKKKKKSKVKEAFGDNGHGK